MEQKTPSQQAVESAQTRIFADKVNSMTMGERPENITIQRERERDMVSRANELLLKYRNGGKDLTDERIIENERWWQIQHWQVMREQKGFKPRSAWLFNCIANKHADAMDAMPTANILPREQGDQQESKRLSSIIPAIMKANDFESVYSAVWWYKLIHGTGVYGVFWDSHKHSAILPSARSTC